MLLEIQILQILRSKLSSTPIIPSQHLNISSETVVPSSSITKSTHRPTARSSAVNVRNRRKIINRTTPYSNSPRKADKQRHSNITLDTFSETISSTINDSTCKNSVSTSASKYWDQHFTGLDAYPEFTTYDDNISLNYLQFTVPFDNAQYVRPVEQSFTFETDFYPNLPGLNYDVIEPSFFSSDPSGEIVLNMESVDPTNITNENPPYINQLSLLGFEPLYYPNSLEFGVIDPALLYLDPPSFTPFSYGRSSNIYQEIP
ncbi:684_t:CDS:1 [Acaulospora colombiana]|uniref:684_t:CDS:1 n=1 Tax=Acaulospora colombiana TaxID=27376 RepID=A0ACA9L3W5_9GLOM|nr:684_t:CDS:1 [Acaulospora colombiana]